MLPVNIFSSGLCGLRWRDVLLTTCIPMINKYGLQMVLLISLNRLEGAKRPTMWNILDWALLLMCGKATLIIIPYNLFDLSNIREEG